MVANVSDDAALQIRHGVMGEAVPCYAVSVVLGGTELRGFIQGSTLPIIQEFERKRALESRIPMPAPPPAPVPSEKKAAVRPVLSGPPFESWSGVDTRGKRMQISPGNTKVTLVTFWSAQSGAARRFVTGLNPTEGEFRGKGLKMYGVVEASDPGRANYYLDDMGLDYPQALDHQRLAAKYNADPAKGTTLVIDASNHIILASSNPAEIHAAVATLLAP